MTRGDLVTIALQGDFGKPRPAVIVQADLFAAHASVTVLPVTGALVKAPLFRIEVEPSAENGLQEISQIMIDKAHTVSRDKVGAQFGRLDDTTMIAVNRALAVWLGFA